LALIQAPLRPRTVRVHDGGDWVRIIAVSGMAKIASATAVAAASAGSGIAFAHVTPTSERAHDGHEIAA
jgi:hypothetical protein